MQDQGGDRASRAALPKLVSGLALRGVLAVSALTLLCSVGIRRPPFGVQAYVGQDGSAWDAARPALLRADGETRDLGYPVSLQLGDGSIYTVYYLTTGGVTHVAASRWELPW